MIADKGTSLVRLTFYPQRLEAPVQQAIESPLGIIKLLFEGMFLLRYFF